MLRLIGTGMSAVVVSGCLFAKSPVAASINDKLRRAKESHNGVVEKEKIRQAIEHSMQRNSRNAFADIDAVLATLWFAPQADFTIQLAEQGLPFLQASINAYCPHTQYPLFVYLASLNKEHDVLASLPTVLLRMMMDASVDRAQVQSYMKRVRSLLAVVEEQMKVLHDILFFGKQS